MKNEYIINAPSFFGLSFEFARKINNLEEKNLKTDEKVRTRWINFYTGGVALFGLIILWFALSHLPSNLFGLIEFIILAAVTELFSVELFVTDRNSRISVSSVIAIASILSFGTWAGAITLAVAGVVISAMTQFSAEKSRTSFIRRAAFNVGMLSVSIGGAGLVYTAAGGGIGNFGHLSDLFPLILCVITNELLNTGILLGILVLQTRKKPLKLWLDDFQWSLPIDILGGIIGSAALAWVFVSFGLTGLILFFIPIMALNYSYRLYVNKMRGYVTSLEKLNKDLDDINIDLLNTLSAVIDASDIYTNGHSKQVAIYAGDIAEKIRLPKEDQETLVIAALLHDIGKVGISEKILGKNERLTQQEYNEIKLHTTIGANIVGQMKGMQKVVPLIKHHHEYWNGEGYPDRLQGESIPLGARILCLADTLDTICSDRPWRPTLSLEEVIIEVKRCSGTQFDPKLVDVLLGLIGEKDRSYFKNSAELVDASNQIASNEIMGNKLRYLKRSMVENSGVNQKN